MNKVICIIPARKSSKRLPNKNTKMLCGKPLITYTIEEALKVDFIDEILITTDDPEVVRIVLNYRLSKLKIVHRPKDLAGDKIPVWQVVEHACLGYPLTTHIILLQPTSPLRLAEDIDFAYGLFLMGDRKLGVVGGCYEFPSHYIKINGTVYIHWLSSIVWNKKFIFKGTIFYMMPKSRSVDIDLQSDFDLAERYMEERLKSG